MVTNFNVMSHVFRNGLRTCAYVVSVAGGRRRLSLCFTSFRTGYAIGAVLKATYARRGIGGSTGDTASDVGVL
jgi:hypothetical protein